jgi:hypothetical protein
MGKVAKLLPEKYKQIAIANEIPLPTVYRRLKSDWDLQRAVTEKPKKVIITQRKETGELIALDRPKGNTISFTPYQDNEELLEKAIAKSGKPKSVFLADIVDSWLKRNKKKIMS